MNEGKKWLFEQVLHFINDVPGELAFGDRVDAARAAFNSLSEEELDALIFDKDIPEVIKEALPGHLEIIPSAQGIMIGYSDESEEEDEFIIPGGATIH